MFGNLSGSNIRVRFGTVLPTAHADYLPRSSRWNFALAPNYSAHPIVDAGDVQCPTHKRCSIFSTK